MKPQGRFKTVKTRKSLPKHVKHSAGQLVKMKSMVQDLLSPFAGRLHFFEVSEKKRSKKKS